VQILLLEPEAVSDVRHKPDRSRCKVLQGPTRFTKSSPTVGVCISGLRPKLTLLSSRLAPLSLNGRTLSPFRVAAEQQRAHSLGLMVRVESYFSGSGASVRSVVLLFASHFVDHLSDGCDDGVGRCSHVVLRIHDDLPATG